MISALKSSFFAALALGLSSAAVAQYGPPEPPKDGVRAGPQPMLFVSPAGLPFRAEPESDTTSPPERWFAAADRDQDGKLSREEFREDFKTAFAVFDTDGSGAITHLEVVNYEEKIFPEISTGSASGPGRGGGEQAQRGGGRRGGPPGGGGGQRGGGEGRSSSSSSSGSPYDMSLIGAARFGFLAIPHPLLDADPQMRRRITLDDYLAIANERFAMLDYMKVGVLDHDALMAKLPKRPERAKGRRGKAGRAE